MNENSILQESEFVTEIACGAIHTLVLTNLNRVLGCGFGENWQLGMETNTTIKSFCEVKSIEKILGQYRQSGYKLPKIRGISAGLSHSGCVIEDHGYIWGAVIGDPDNTEAVFKTPFKVSRNIKSLHCGEFLTVFLTKSGKVLALGSNIQGQLGDRNFQTHSLQAIQVYGVKGQIDKVALGRNFVLALDSGAEKLWAWGSN
jgi:alpha-tubulin suppressor-like RCC1 family protein